MCSTHLDDLWQHYSKLHNLLSNCLTLYEGPEFVPTYSYYSLKGAIHKAAVIRPTMSMSISFLNNHFPHSQPLMFPH